MEALKVDSEGVHKFLLGPMFLYGELVGAFLPGVLFLLLLLLKDVAVVQHALAISSLGYKTKMGAGLLMAYVIGKVVQLPGTYLIYGLALWGLNGKWLKTVAKKQLEPADVKMPVYDHLGDAGKSLVGGGLLGLMVKGIPNPIEILLVSMSNLTFQLSSGLVLLFASLIAGDGTSLRRWEAVIGAVLLISTLVQVLTHSTAIVAMIGMAVANTLSSASKSELELLKIVGTALFAGATKTQPAPSGTPPVGPVAQTTGPVVKDGGLGT
jgi:hypothetical protein